MRMAVAAALIALAPAASSARAEGSFFDFLFGKSSEPAPVPHAAPSRDPRARPRPSPQPRTQNARRVQSPAAPVVKSTDFVVAVFGDAFAVSVARGLNDADSASASRQVLDRSSDDASLDTTEPAVWDKAIDAARTQAGRMDAAVVMLGSNDGASLLDPQGQKQGPGSPGWRKLYGDRVARLADQFRDRQIPLIWIGLPIVRDAERAQLYAAINEVVQDRATREGASFVDTWQPFADENGDFSTMGPDVDGRSATLRWTNGWNFTRAGAKKLASFILPDLTRLRDRARSTHDLATISTRNADAFDQALNIDVNAQILREAGLPVPSAASRGATEPGPVVVLTAAPVSTDGVLASVRLEPSTALPTASRAGRADDFTWPRR